MSLRFPPSFSPIKTEEGCRLAEGMKVLPLWSPLCLPPMLVTWEGWTRAVPLEVRASLSQLLHDTDPSSLADRTGVADELGKSSCSFFLCQIPSLPRWRLGSVFPVIIGQVFSLKQCNQVRKEGPASMSTKCTSRV